MKKNEVKVAGLFCGAGGLDLGFAEAGFKVCASSDLDKFCCETMRLNHGHYDASHCVIEKSVVDLDKVDLSKDIDFVIGGPPCQSFSAAGRRAGGVAGVNDFRGSLFWHYARIIERLDVVGFLFENVRGLLSSNKGEDWSLIKSEFEKLGYRAFHRVLDAADYGVPQYRERVITVFLRDFDEFLFPRPTHGPDSSLKIDHVSVGDAIEDLIDPAEVVPEYGGKYGHLIPDVPPGMNYLHFTEELGHPNPLFAWRSKFSDFLYKVDPKLPSKTMVASPSKFSGPFHWLNRRFTIPELKRIQSFPDDYLFAGSYNQQVKQIGNSVAPRFAFQVAKAVMKQVFDVDAFPDVELLPAEATLGFDKRKARKAKRTRKKTVYQKRIQTDQLNLFEESEVASQENTSCSPIEERIGYLTPRKILTSQSTNLAEFSVFGEMKDNAWDLTVSREAANDEKIGSLKLNLRFDRVIGGAFNRINCSLASTSPWDVYAAWDAINLAISRSSSFPNISPLYGHFTEPYPKFDLNIEYSFRRTGIIKFLDAITDFGFLASTQDLDVLTKLFGKRMEPLAIAKKLRFYGFDVRVHETNRAIPKDRFRVCYPYPRPIDDMSFVCWREVGSHATADVTSIPAHSN